MTRCAASAARTRSSAIPRRGERGHSHLPSHFKRWKRDAKRRRRGRHGCRRPARFVLTHRARFARIRPQNPATWSSKRTALVSSARPVANTRTSKRRDHIIQIHRRPRTPSHYVAGSPPSSCATCRSRHAARPLSLLRLDTAYDDKQPGRRKALWHVAHEALKVEVSAMRSERAR